MLQFGKKRCTYSEQYCEDNHITTEEYRLNPTINTASDERVITGLGHDS